MDFPHVEEETEARYQQLWPLRSQNEKLKEAAKDAPGLIKFSKQGDGAHYRLYEERVPAAMDVDAVFGAYVTDEAKSASLAEKRDVGAARDGVEAMARRTAAEAYPEEVRYYPAIAEGNRERFLKAAKDAGLTTKGTDEKPADVFYSNAPSVKAFVSRVGPVPALAEWQTPEAQALWKSAAERLEKAHDGERSRAGEAVEASALRASGKHFLADNAKGLVMPSTKTPKERDAVVRSISEASLEDLKTVQAVTTTEHSLLSRKQYAIQIKAAQAKDPALTAEAFNGLSFSDRRVAADYNELPDADFTRMMGLQYGKRALGDELKSRGEHISRDEALDKKAKAVEPVEKKAPIDEKKKSMKPSDDKAKTRAGSHGAAHAAALMGRGR